MIRLTRNQIVGLQEQLIEASGGLSGIHSEALLDAALQAPFASYAGVDLFPTVTAKAARLAFGLTSNHPFRDGNKRIGVLAMLVFCDLNDVTIEATDDELVHLGLGLADGTWGLDRCHAWVEAHVRTR
jgi:death-on-curing protein